MIFINLFRLTNGGNEIDTNKKKSTGFIIKMRDVVIVCVWRNLSTRVQIQTGRSGDEIFSKVKI